MRVLCLGDSNTYGFDPRAYFGGRYPEKDRWVNILAQKTGWEVQNAGENGLEIPHRAYDLCVYRQFVSNCLPLDRVVVMLGYNDLLQGAEVPEVLARRMGTAFADAGQWNIELTYDNVHFSEAGHRAFAEGICPVLLSMTP